MTTDDPVPPVGGENDVIVRPPPVMTWKLPAVAPSPPGLCTVSVAVPEDPSRHARRDRIIVRIPSLVVWYQRPGRRRRCVPVNPDPVIVTGVPNDTADRRERRRCGHGERGQRCHQHAHDAEYERQRGRAGGCVFLFWNLMEDPPF